MALTDQPYLPLYVDDWMNNNKLKLCSPASHGVMIAIMCIMHKEPTYGKILLKQKFKQTDKQIHNFALQVAKQCAFDLLDVEPALAELIEEQVLVIEEDFLVCNRMVKDAEISAKRASSGGKGGKKTQEKHKEFASDFAKANLEANPVIENEYGNESKEDSKDLKTLSEENKIESVSDEERLAAARRANPKQFPVPDDFNGLPDMKMGAALQYLRLTKNPDVTTESVVAIWDLFKNKHLTGKKFYADNDAVYSHFLETLKFEKFQTQNHGKNFARNSGGKPVPEPKAKGAFGQL
jgi:hypothetical protein